MYKFRSNPAKKPLSAKMKPLDTKKGVVLPEVERGMLRASRGKTGKNYDNQP